MIPLHTWNTGHGQVQVLNTGGHGTNFLPLWQLLVLQSLSLHPNHDEVGDLARPSVPDVGDLLGVVVVLLVGDLLLVVAVPVLDHVQVVIDPISSLDHNTSKNI